MKKLLFGLSIVLLATPAGLFFGACSFGAQEPTPSQASSSPQAKASDQDKGHMEHMGNINHMDFSQYRNDRCSALIDAYEGISKGLDSDDQSVAASGAKNMMAAIQQFKKTNPDLSRRKEVSEIIESANENAEHISRSEISHQKEHFEILTTDLSDLFKLIGPKSSKD